MSLSESLRSRNCLAAIRLSLALLVVLSHAWPLTGREGGPAIHGDEVGALAVYGFFSISGFLITRSRHTHPSGARFLWHRFLRIYPALWVGLAVTSFILAPIAYVHVHNSLAGFSLASSGRYVAEDATGAMRQYSVPGTLRSVPFPSAWDGSLWTLIYEVTFYIVLFILAAVGLLRRSVTVFATLALTAVVILIPASDLAKFNPMNIASLEFAVPFGLSFASGALLHMYSDRIPMRWWWAAAAAAVVYFGLATLSQPIWLIAIPLAYLMLWLGVALPFSGPSGRRDFSLGVFVYAFPIQQLLVTFGAAKWDVWWYFVVTLILVAPLAAISRLLVETPADRLKPWSPSKSRTCALVAERVGAWWPSDTRAEQPAPQSWST